MMRCWQRAALGFAGLGIATVISTRDDRPARGGAPACRGPRTALPRAGAPGGRALLRARPHALGGAERWRSQRPGPRGCQRARLRPRARHVALWRPDRVPQRLAVAGEMIAAARTAGDRHAELQAHNWRVTDCSSSVTCRPGARRSPVMRGSPTSCGFPPSRYTPLWAAMEAMLAGSYDEAEELASTAEQAGLRAADRNAELFAGMVRICGALQREAFQELSLDYLEDKIANSPRVPPTAARTPGSSRASARPGARERARRGDGAAARVRRQLALAADRMRRGDHAARRTDPRRRPLRASRPYAGRPATAGRAVWSHGAVTGRSAGSPSSRPPPRRGAPPPAMP